MQPPQKHPWINVMEVKDQLTTKLGPEKSKQYFDYLKQFLSLKLSKLEFDKLCIRTLGTHNTSLHNQLIRSILKNACIRKSPLPPPPPPPPPLTADDHSTTSEKKGYDENRLVQHQTESLRRKSGKEVSSRTLVHAPLGISYWPVNNASSTVNSKRAVVFDSGDLIETNELKERMEQLAATKGLQRVSMDCAYVLSNGLEAYMKRLIRSFSEINGARSEKKLIKNSLMKHQGHLRPLNGVRPGHHYQIQNKAWPFQTMEEHESKRAVSLLDFTVAMNLNPQQLGKDWPMLLEKICTHDFKN